MSRIYSVPYNGTLTAAGTDSDLLSIQPADDRPVRLRGFRLSQASQVGDANEKDIRVTVRRLTATVTIGSGGSSISSAAPVDDAGGTVWAFTARCNDTTVATTSGTNQIIEDFAWNMRNSPCDFWLPDVDFCEKAKQTEALIVRMETTLGADVANFSATFWIEEY
jgi:hypothetical protein